MANKTIGQLTAKTTPASADVFALEDTEDTKKINYDALADAILNKITSKNYTVAGSSQTLINAINTLKSSLNHHELLTFSDKPVTTAYASTGASFTLAKTSIVRIDHIYNKTLPVTIGVKSSESVAAGSIAYTENSGKVENVGYISVTAILNPGTYYIWASAKIASTNNFRVEVYFAI